jgi:hypothetical protein
MHKMTKAKGAEVKMKTCPVCNETLPLTPEYWRRDRSTKDGFQRVCKRDESEFIKSHHIHFGRIDIIKKGSQGVTCPLWTKYCGVCATITECWRVDWDDPKAIPALLQETK